MASPVFVGGCLCPGRSDMRGPAVAITRLPIRLSPRRAKLQKHRTESKTQLRSNPALARTSCTGCDDRPTPSPLSQPLLSLASAQHLAKPGPTETQPLSAVLLSPLPASKHTLLGVPLLSPGLCGPTPLFVVSSESQPPHFRSQWELRYGGRSDCQVGRFSVADGVQGAQKLLASLFRTGLHLKGFLGGG